MAQDYRTLKLEVLAETKQFVKGMNDANKETLTFGDKLGDFAKKAGVALAAVGAAAGAMAIKVGKEAVAAASDLAESTSKVQVIFGDAAEEIRKFASQAAVSLGQTRTQAQNAASTFATFGKAAGLTGTQLADFSTEFVKLASDLASFNNTSVDQAITALGAALRGESEPIRSYGVLLNDATLKAKAMELGIYSGTGTLTAQQKVLAAHKVVLAQTTDAQGDFARTADGMANSQRILSARLEEAKIILGEALLPIALNVVNLFNDKFLPIIEKVAQAFSNPSGSGLADQVKSFVTQARDFLDPILTTIQESFGKVSTAITDNKDNFKAFFDAIKNIYDFAVTYFVPLLKNQIVNAISGIGTAFEIVARVVGPIIGTISGLISGIVTTVDTAIKSIVNLANKAIDGINAVISAYNRIPALPNVPTVPNIGMGSAGVGSNTVPSSSLPSGFTSGTSKTPATKTSGSTNLPSGSIPSISTSGTTSAAAAGRVDTGEGTDWGVLMLNAVDLFTDTIRQQSKSLEGLAALSPELARQVQAGTFVPASKQNVSLDLAGARAAEERGNVIVNVNAPSVIDEEGFTRAVILALNNSTNRGTTGAGDLRTNAQVI
jgi:hypothetical protein